MDLNKADPNACKKICEEDPNCVVCTYVEPGVQGRSARCWLKNKIPNAMNDSCCVSWLKICNQTIIDVISYVEGVETPVIRPPKNSEIHNIVAINQTTGFIKDAELPGYDYKSLILPKNDPILCSEACMQDPTCAACTYVKPGIQSINARCWLKNAVPKLNPDKNSESWVKANFTLSPVPSQEHLSDSNNRPFFHTCNLSWTKKQMYEGTGSEYTLWATTLPIGSTVEVTLEPKDLKIAKIKEPDGKLLEYISVPESDETFILHFDKYGSPIEGISKQLPWESIVGYELCIPTISTL